MKKKKNLEDESIAGKSFVFIKKSFQEIAANAEWSSLALPDIKKALQDKSILPDTLTKSEVEKLKLLVEQYTKELSKEEDTPKKKSAPSELEDEKHRKKPKHSNEKESSKYKKTNSKHKSKKHKHSSESDSADSISESKSEPKKRKKVKIDLGDPQVKKKKLIH